MPDHVALADAVADGVTVAVGVADPDNLLEGDADFEAVEEPLPVLLTDAVPLGVLDADGVPDAEPVALEEDDEDGAPEPELDAEVEGVPDDVTDDVDVKLTRVERDADDDPVKDTLGRPLPVDEAETVEAPLCAGVVVR